MKTNFKQLSAEEIAGLIEGLGQKPYRVNQIINWIYKKLAASFDEMTDLPKALREELKKKSYVSNLHLLQRQFSSDGAQKFLFELEDGKTIESVLIPNSRGVDRFTLCISSQVGCAMGCLFCKTGKLGLKRNLKAYEIVDQIIAVRRILLSSAQLHSEFTSLNSPLTKGEYKGIRDGIKGGYVTNIVFMGMGEPLNNLREVTSALWRITRFMGFSKRKITVSTAGIVPMIYELAEKAPEINLAVSLNATTDEIRNQIMPINRKYPLKELVKACREFPLSPRRRITFEYVLLDKINDSKEDASRLAKLLSGIRSKVNLIPFNPYPLHRDVARFKKPTEKKILEFQGILQKAGVTAIIRKSFGADISAACGQLKAAYLMNSE